jgi:aryl-alcohol dehydrogenase-like predicted oxidoreductase
MGMSWAYVSQRQDQETSVRAIRHAFDHGVTLFDTADIYGPFANERLLSRALTGIRDQVTIATKGGLIGWTGDHVGDVTIRLDGRPDHLKAACDASLLRLGVDHIELYYLHRIDPAVPLAESWGALAELRDAGKVRHLGISEASVAQLVEVHRIAPVTAVQSELSLWTRDPVSEVLPWCRTHGVAFVPFSPLGRGFLADCFTDEEPDPDDLRARMPRFQPEAATRNQRILAGVREVAARYDATVGQVALAWTLAQGEHVVPIPGSTKVAHIAENSLAAELRLDEDDLVRLDGLPTAVGTRY